jgi:hypothetical protein
MNWVRHYPDVNLGFRALLPLEISSSHSSTV